MWAREWSESSLTPHFDSRAFVLPVHEVENYFWWRQSDAIRNSISMLAQSKFSHKELHGKDCETMIEMLKEKHDINWDDLPMWCQRGSWVVKDVHAYRTKWVAREAPRFLGSELFDNYLADPVHPE